MSTYRLVVTLSTMPNVSVVTALWNGFSGAPGYSRFHFAELTNDAMRSGAGAAVRSFFFGFASVLMSSWSIAVQPTVQTFDAATGLLQGEAGMGTPPATMPGTGATTTIFEGGSGTVINWLTGQVHAGKKIRGRTFLVPLLSTAFSSDGTLGSATQNSIITAGNALVSTSGITSVVWSRQWDTSKPPHQTGGFLTNVNSVAVPDRAAQLRTRRT